MSHEGDAKFLPRAIASLGAQMLPPELMELQIVFDGTPSAEAEGFMEEAASKVRFGVNVVMFKEKNGYYTVPRNRAISVALGHYIVHMDADNEFAPDHLQALLEGIRWAHGTNGWPHFAYTRRKFVLDEGANPDLPTGDEKGHSPFIEWTDPMRQESLRAHPKANFVDTGDFIVGKAALYRLADRTGFIWNPEMRRFGDWDLVKRMAECGFRGKALDIASHIYHWTGENLQVVRGSPEVMMIPESDYNRLKDEGKIK
jgi:glycosyltransferase involved in cell wall biosynthesis